MTSRCAPLPDPISTANANTTLTLNNIKYTLTVLQALRNLESCTRYHTQIDEETKIHSKGGPFIFRNQENALIIPDAAIVYLNARE